VPAAGAVPLLVSRHQHSGQRRGSENESNPGDGTGIFATRCRTDELGRPSRGPKAINYYGANRLCLR